MLFIVFNIILSIKLCIADGITATNNQSVALSLNLAQDIDTYYGKWLAKK